MPASVHPCAATAAASVPCSAAATHRRTRPRRGVRVGVGRVGHEKNKKKRPRRASRGDEDSANKQYWHVRHAPANTPGRRCRCLGGARGVIEDSADNRGWPQTGASRSAQTHVRARSRPPSPPPPRPPPRLAAGMYRRLTTKSCKRPHTRQHAALPATAAVATDAGTPAVAALTLTDACPPSPPPPPAASLTRGRGYRMRRMRHTVTWLSSQTATAAAHPPAAAVALAAMHFTRLKACSRRGRRPCCCR